MSVSVTSCSDGRLLQKAGNYPTNLVFVILLLIITGCTGELYGKMLYDIKSLSDFSSLPVWCLFFYSESSAVKKCRTGNWFTALVSWLVDPGTSQRGKMMAHRLYTHQPLMKHTHFNVTQYSCHTAAMLWLTLQMTFWSFSSKETKDYLGPF